MYILMINIDDHLHSDLNNKEDSTSNQSKCTQRDISRLGYTIYGSTKLDACNFSITLISRLHVMYKYGIFVRHRGKQGFIDPGSIHQV